MSEAEERPAIVDFSDSERLKTWFLSLGFDVFSETGRGLESSPRFTGFMRTGAGLESSPELEQEIKMRAERKSKIILYNPPRRNLEPPVVFSWLSPFFIWS